MESLEQSQTKSAHQPSEKQECSLLSKIKYLLKSEYCPLLTRCGKPLVGIAAAPRADIRKSFLKLTIQNKQPDAHMLYCLHVCLQQAVLPQSVVLHCQKNTF